MAISRPVLEDPNQDVATLILDLAEVYRPSPRFWGYKRASRTIRRYPQFLSELTDQEILKIRPTSSASDLIFVVV